MLASPSTLNRYIADKHFAGDTLHSLIVRALGDPRCISVKEVVESFEVFQRLRKPIRSKYVMDLCCGHGLVGMLMVIFEPDVESVTLCDRRIPRAVTAVLPRSSPSPPGSRVVFGMRLAA